MNRRQFFSGGTAFFGVAAGGQSASAAGYKRCEQIHERDKITEKDLTAIEWRNELKIPAIVKLEAWGSDAEPTPPVGHVHQYTAPEWHWLQPNSQKPAAAPPGGESPRPEDIYHDPAHTDGGSGVPQAYFAEMWAIDFVTEIIPGWLTHMLTYAQAQSSATLEDVRNSADNPGPVFKADVGQHLIIRYWNKIQEDLGLDVSVHLHGGHTPAHSDGHPNFLIPPGQARDYFYPNPVPLHTKYEGGEWKPDRERGWEFNEAPSTMWYHDHAEDITAHNAWMGLASYYLTSDQREKKLQEEGVLPPQDFDDPEKNRDIPLAIRDICLCKITDPSRQSPDVLRKKKELESGGCKIKGEARIHFDPFDHNGTLGNVILVNGQARPLLKVRPEKYRLRLLNASLARFYNIEFRIGSPMGKRVEFKLVGRDSWLLPVAHPAKSSFLGMANRSDLVLDFTAMSPCEDIYMVSSLNQKDGRGPGHGDKMEDREEVDLELLRSDDSLSEILVLMKISVIDPAPSSGANGNDVDTAGGNDGYQFEDVMTGRIEVIEESPTHPEVLRGHELIPMPFSENAPDGWLPFVREFNFERGRGAWQINGRFYDHHRSDAVTRLWETEYWILRNRSGGWWHPIHIHLESHQQVYIKARTAQGAKIELARQDFIHPRNWKKIREISDPSERNERILKIRRNSIRHNKETIEYIKRSGMDPTVWNCGIKHDTSLLGANTEVHLLMKFRTFEGPFVFHCHNLNHEDMRMMFQFDPREGQNPQWDLPVRPSHWYFDPES